MRDDVPGDVLQCYLELVLDGLVARLASGEDPQRLAAVLDLVENSVRRNDLGLERNATANKGTRIRSGVTRRHGERWLGPPRLRSVVPDSRSMLWIDPYDLPVLATRLRMLAPPS